LIKFLRYWLPVLVVLAGISYLSSIPQDDLPSFNFPGLDKIVHLLMYSFLSFTFGRAFTYPIRHETEWTHYRPRLVLGIIFTALYGIIDEWHQSFVPGRAVEILDWVADITGAFVGAAIVWFYRAWIVAYERRKSMTASGKRA